LNCTDKTLCMAILLPCSQLTEKQYAGNRLEFGREDVVGTFRELIKLHGDDIVFLKRFFKIMLSLINECPGNQDIFGKFGFCEQLMERYGRQDDSEKLMYLGRIITLLCLNMHKENQSKFGSPDNMKCFVSALWKCKESEGSYEVLCILILALCSNRPDIKSNVIGCELGKSVQWILSNIGSNMTRRIEGALMILQFFLSLPEIKNEIVLLEIGQSLQNLEASTPSNRIRQHAKAILRSLGLYTSGSPSVSPPSTAGLRPSSVSPVPAADIPVQHFQV